LDRNFEGRNVVDDFVVESLNKYAPGRNYFDIGPLFGTVNQTLTTAKTAGAARVSAADIQNLDSPAWQKLREHCASLGLDSFNEFSLNIDDPRAAEIVGSYDFVFCSGIIYHAPSPFRTIQQIASITSRYAMIGSAIVPDRVANEYGAIDFDGGRSIFVPALTDNLKAVMAKHFTDDGIEIMHINAADSWPWRINGDVNYGPWW
jgi:hypothetical protein